MQFRVEEARRELQAFDFRKLFIEQMGWDNPGADLSIRFEGQSIQVKAIAQKRGLGVFIVPPIQNKIPDYPTRRKIETEVRKLIDQHILIFTDAEGKTQKWQWVRRELNKPSIAREFEFTKGQSGDALLQRLQKMYFSLEDEEALGGITDASMRVRSAFNVEKVTKKFYERFKDEHTVFLKFIKGIPDKEMQEWYTSVTLNRLMFVYFIQKKNFLNNDVDYLRNHLKASQGKDKYYTDFLCPLFFDGFAKKRHTAETKKLLGKIPYLNGGIFEKHQIEELHGEKIQIPDKAFEQLFDFFDDYRWHLDERPNKDDKEINPDVLGYIFEKYINQKQMGAYYTKEDITEYISKNTIIPHLFDVAQKECKVAFDLTPDPSPFRRGEIGGTVWRHLQADPDRYIYEAVRKGVDKTLPAETAAGESDAKRREGWNKPADEEFALPTEIWREVVARRRRYQEVKEKLTKGEVTSINDLITLNLDIRQFAQDVIEDSDADLLAAFWKALTQIKILDPTVGSGAFLFAALNILEPLYEACLERMSALVEELDGSQGKHSPKKYEPFRKALEQVRQRPDEDYFIFKSIIINNLYGVDIMEEAVEICKLRLFLKLASQVEPDASKENLGIEPLPDIDFNIRAGNTLVGFATREDVKRSVQFGTVGGVQSEKLFAMPEEDAQLKRIEEKAEDVDRLYKLFRQQQTEYGGEVLPEDKKALEKKLKALDNELNILLAKQYAIHNPKGEEFKKWLESHTPFHWFVEFFGIMNDGGFDVIIGNPPYVEYSKVKKEYTLQNYRTEDSGNLYAYVIERCLETLSNKGYMGMIVQLPIVCTDRMIPLQKECLTNSNAIWFSNFDDRPGRLFDGLEHIRATIFVLKKGKPNEQKVFSTTYNRWYSESRNILFPNLEYQEISKYLMQGAIPKIGDNIAKHIREKISRFSPLGNELIAGNSPVYFHNAPQYWIRAMNYIPYFKNERNGVSVSTQIKTVNLTNETDALAVTAALNSSLFYWWFLILSDCRHLNLREIETFPIGLKTIGADIKKELANITKKLMVDFKKHSQRKDAFYKATGKVSYDEYYPKYSKPIIDEIDRALARHYGLSDEELDFIINYDVKYRMGASAGEEE